MAFEDMTEVLKQHLDEEISKVTQTQREHSFRLLKLDSKQKSNQGDLEKAKHTLKCVKEELESVKEELGEERRLRKKCEKKLEEVIFKVNELLIKSNKKNGKCEERVSKLEEKLDSCNNNSHNHHNDDGSCQSQSQNQKLVGEDGPEPNPRGVDVVREEVGSSGQVDNNDDNDEHHPVSESYGDEDEDDDEKTSDSSDSMAASEMPGTSVRSSSVMTPTTNHNNASRQVQETAIVTSDSGQNSQMMEVAIIPIPTPHAKKSSESQENHAFHNEIITTPPISQNSNELSQELKEQIEQVEKDFNLNSNCTNNTNNEVVSLPLPPPPPVEQYYFQNITTTNQCYNIPIVPIPPGNLEKVSKAMIVHAAYPSDPNGLTCVCGSQKKDKKALAEHVFNGNLGKRWKCDAAICGKSFARFNKLQEHKNKVHGISIVKGQQGCRKCLQIFDTKLEHAKHLKECKRRMASCTTSPGQVSSSTDVAETVGFVGGDLNHHVMNNANQQFVEGPGGGESSGQILSMPTSSGDNNDNKRDPMMLSEQDSSFQPSSSKMIRLSSIEEVEELQEQESRALEFTIDSEELKLILSTHSVNR